MLKIGKQTWHTVKEVAQQLQISIPTVYNWYYAGKLKSAMRVGIKLYFPQTTLDEVLKLALDRTGGVQRTEKTLQEDAEMVRLFCDQEHPKTLEEIGIQFGLTRERIRQRLKRAGVTGKHGGSSLRSSSRGVLQAQALQKHREKRCQKKWGVTPEEYRRIHIIFIPQQISKIKQIYFSLRKKSQREYIPWAINLTEFAKFIQSHAALYGMGKKKDRRISQKQISALHHR